MSSRSRFSKRSFEKKIVTSKMPSFAEKLDDYFVRYLAYFNYRNYIDRINLCGDEKVLEIGCGGGNLSRFLAERLPSGKLVCIDNSEYWIEKAKKRLNKFRNIGFALENILNFNEGNFNAIVIHYVLHDIPKEKREILVEILRKSLKQKGEIYIREPTRESHGIPSEVIKSLMLNAGFLEKKSKENYSFPIRGKVYEGIFQK